ncbi:MAG: hypothetical protein NDJ89_12320 [Oligoflexia bacterium]|nr:hypothetical protein [Oligoflexia bacterium]
MKGFFLLVFLLAGPLRASAEESLLLYLGGGGEPLGEAATEFDPALEAAGNYFSSTPWKSRISFDGGHSATESLVRRSFRQAESTSPFTPDTFRAALVDAKKSIESGRISKLLVMVDSHGVPPVSGRTHPVAVGPSKGKLDPNAVLTAAQVSLDDLGELAELARRRGVKLAIIDHTCHSGATQALANESTCVISGSGPKHFSFHIYTKEFNSRLKAGKNLEQVFLETRAALAVPNFPMISSPAGQAIASEYYDLLTPYLFYWEAQSASSKDKLSNYLKETVSGNAGCRRESEFARLERDLQELAGASRGFASGGAEFSALQAAIRAYKANQDALLGELRGIRGLEHLDRKEYFTARVGGGEPARLDFTWMELLMMDEIPKTIAYVRKAVKEEKSPKERARLQAAEQAWQAALQKRQAILAEYPALEGYDAKIKALTSRMKDTYALAQKVSAEERKLYAHLYENASKRTHAPNPCRDFVL